MAYSGELINFFWQTPVQCFLMSLLKDQMGAASKVCADERGFLSGSCCLVALRSMHAVIVVMVCILARQAWQCTARPSEVTNAELTHHC